MVGRWSGWQRGRGAGHKLRAPRRGHTTAARVALQQQRLSLVTPQPPPRCPRAPPGPPSAAHPRSVLPLWCRGRKPAEKRPAVWRMSHGGLMMMMMEVVVVVPHFEGAAHSASCRTALVRVVARPGSVGRPTTALCVGCGGISLQHAAQPASGAGWQTASPLQFGDAVCGQGRTQTRQWRSGGCD